MTWPSYSPECRKEINEILRKGGSLSAYRANPNVGVGPREHSQAWRLEREIEKKFKVKHAIAVNSGTAALHASLMALDIKGKEVIVSPYTFSASISAVILAGAIPVFADIDPDTFCLSFKTVRSCITKKTAAIMPVHLFGYFAPIDEMAKFEVPIIEDACQAVGASRSGKYSGTVGIAGTYSFNGSKNVPSGEGGAVITNNDGVAERVRAFVNHEENFGYRTVSPNYRMHELIACLARHGLKDLDARNERRQALAFTFASECETWKARAEWLDVTGPKVDHVFYVTPFVLERGINRDRFVKRCAKQGLVVGPGYITPPLHHYAAFRRYATRPLPIVDDLSFKRLCLIYDFTPDKPISYARRAAKIVAEVLA